MTTETPMYEAIPGHRKHDKRGAMMDVCPRCCTDDDGQPVVLDNGSVGRARFSSCWNDAGAPVWACGNCGAEMARRHRRTKSEIAFDKVRGSLLRRASFGLAA